MKYVLVKSILKHTIKSLNYKQKKISSKKVRFNIESNWDKIIKKQKEISLIVK